MVSIISAESRICTNVILGVREEGVIAHDGRPPVEN
jgi:hypothetical protein